MTKQKIFDYTLKAFLFLSPIFFFRQYQLSLARGLFFIFGAFALFGVSLGLAPKRKLSNQWLSLFFILALSRVFFDNEVIGQPQAEWFNFWFISCSSFIYILSAVLLFYTVYTYSENISQYFKPVFIVAILNFILVIAQKLHWDFMWTNTPSLNGFMENSSQLGQYSALALPAVIFVNSYLFFIPLTTLILSNSISPILSGLIGLCILCWVAKVRKLILLIMGVGLLLGILNFNYIKTKWACRPVMWQKTLKIALQKPFLGHGYQSFNYTVLEQKTVLTAGRIEYARPHNDYFHTTQELGFPIVVCLGLFFISLFKRFKTLGYKDWLSYCLLTSIVISLINMFGQSFIRYASVAGTFIVLLALFCAKVEDGND